MFLNYLCIFIGGGLGAVCRVLSSRILPQYILKIFPLQIISINIVGCFIMGSLIGFMIDKWNPNALVRTFLTTGFLGGFTTFSSFSLEFSLLIEKKLYFASFMYVLVTVIFSLLSFFIGLKIFRLI